MTTLPSEPVPGEPTDPASAAEAVLAEAEAVVEASAEPVEPAMDHLDVPRRLLLVHAHPDDETINNGATMAKYAAAGGYVTLITCTLGEEGEILVPGLEHLAADAEDRLGQHRIGELAAAMEALGVRDHRYLGGAGRYRDSGMMGVASNQRPECFWQADLDEAARELVAVLREVRPQVVVTYDEDGGYGHPDHIQAHRVTVRAIDLAADPAVPGGVPWTVSKLYYCALPVSVLQEGLRRLREAGETTGFAAMDPEAPFPTFVQPDDAVTTQVEAPGFVDAKLAALRAHATQIAVDGPFFALSNNVGQQAWATEFYRLVRGEPGPHGASGREEDLFAGL